MTDRVLVSAALFDLLATHGVRPDAVGLASDGARQRISTEQFFALWRAVEDRSVGLTIGAHAVDHASSVAMTAALHAASLGEALVTLGRYKRLVCPEQLLITRERGEASVRFHWVLAGSEVPRLLVDSTFAGVLTMARRGTGTALTPRRIELARRASDRALLSSFFGCEVRFGAAFDRMVLDERALGLPFVTHDASALEAMVPGLEAALVDRQAGRSFGDDVRVAIAHHLGGDRPTVARVARRLHVSARTLQRRLEEEHTSYQEQLTDVRRRTARRLLTHTSLDPVEVAFVLGFEEPNSFIRAFREWEGTTPGRWRARREAPQVVARAM